MSGRPLESAPPDELRVATDPTEQLGRAFKATSAAVRRLRGRERRRVGGLRDAQYTLLFGLCEHAELSSSELAHLAELSPASATEMLDELVQAGLVRRVRSERDRRVVLVSLSEPGRALVEEHRARFEPRWRAAFADFSEEELETAIAVLDRMRVLFEEYDEER
ncbi:MAG TPA: MarR family transcriptional regulator [Solirubrobacteraceae bacterium]|jgi:DNA-binding MarR family transcriptional regulator